MRQNKLLRLEKNEWYNVKLSLENEETEILKFRKIDIFGGEEHHLFSSWSNDYDIMIRSDFIKDYVEGKKK